MWLYKFPQDVSIYKEIYSIYPVRFIFFTLFLKLICKNDLYYLIIEIFYYAINYRLIGSIDRLYKVLKFQSMNLLRILGFDFISHDTSNLFS